MNASMARFTSALFLIAALFAGVPIFAEPDDSDIESVTDCRYLTTENPGIAFDAADLGDIWFPEGDLFRPLMADLREARFYTSLRRVTFKGSALPTGTTGNTINAGITGIGTEFGLWRKSTKRRCDGVQVGVMAMISSQFNLDVDSDALINTDFVVGPSVSLRRGRFSARIQIFHQSSHLGDEFLLQNPGFDRINLSFEAMTALVSYEGNWWRVYGGGGYLTGARPELDPGIMQWGFELRSPHSRYKTKLTPVFGADFNSLQTRDWDITTSLAGGIEMSNPSGTRRYRAQLVYLNGFIPFGQFFNSEKIENYGIQFQFDY